jgi:hypothetical protein
MRLPPGLLCSFCITLFANSTPATAQVATIEGRDYRIAARPARSAMYDAAIRYAPAELTAPFSVIFAHSEKGYYRAEIAPGRVTLTKVAVGAKPVSWSSPFRLEEPLRSVTARRLQNLVVILVNERLAVQALDTAFGPGQLLVDVTKGAPRPTKARTSPREPLGFADDFMVTAEEAKQYRGWQVLAGKWDTKSTREDEKTQQAYVERSSNPFAYQGTPPKDGEALSVAGESSWCSYRARASVKCLGAGAAGLAFACADAKNYWLVRLDCESRFEEPREVRLVRVVDGKPSLRGRTWVRARTERWYELRAEVEHGRVRVRFQGAPVLEARDRDLVGGRVGLWASGSEVAFDDVSVEQLQRFRSDYPTAEGGYVALESGAAWQKANGGFAPTGGRGRRVWGDPAWTGGAVTAELRLGRSGSVGLIAGAAVPDGYVLTLASDGTGSLFAPGPTSRRLVAFRHKVQPGDWARVALNLAEEGMVSGYVGDRLVARAKALHKPRGGVGVAFDRAEGAAYRRLLANRSPKLLAEHQIGNAIFLGDAYMTSWATEKGQWIPDDGLDRAQSMGGYQFDGHNEFWRKGDYYGNYVMILPLTIAAVPAPGQPIRHTPITGGLSLHFEAGPGDVASGYTVAVRATGDGAYAADLKFGQEVIASANGLKPAEGANEIRIYNTDRYLWAKLGGREIFSVEKAKRGVGTRIAATRNGNIDFDRLAVHAEKLDDNAFERAPTRWRVVGDWQITNRFKCDPRWSWMGVDSEPGYSALWHTREFPGDVTVELYAAMKMRSSRPYYFPSDLNLTISADRELPASGYTVLVGGWKNKKTALLRNGKVVRNTEEKYLPDTRDSYPSSAMLHRRWFYVKLRRTGSRVRLYLDNKLYLDYTDPKPLTGGKLGVWTNEQNIMVARVQVYYSKAEAPSPVVAAPERRPEPPAGPPRLVLGDPPRTDVLFDFESGTQGWESEIDGNARVDWDPTTRPRNGGTASLRIVNAEKPGRFVARLPWPGRKPKNGGPATVNLLHCPHLSFDYCIPKGVRINLYFDVKPVDNQAGRTYFIALTGPTKFTQSIKRLGSFPDAQADGRWRTARFDVAGALRRLYPKADAVLAHSFRFALEERGTYSAAGLGGNALGAAYHIDNFTVACAAVDTSKITWDAVPDAVGYATSVTDRCDSDPGAMRTAGEPGVTLPPGKPGELRYLHVRPILKSGPQAPVARVPIYDAGRKLEVVSVDPPDRTRWGGGPIRIRLRSEQMAVLQPRKLSVTVGTREVKIGDPALQIDWNKAAIEIDPARLPVSLKDGAVVACSARIAGVGQGGGPTEERWGYIAALAEDKTPPGRVSLARVLPHPRKPGQTELEPLVSVDDFEEHRRSWSPRQNTQCGLDDTTAASGRRSLAIYSAAEGGDFQIIRELANRRVLGHTPVIEFDYRASAELRTDFFVQGRGVHVFRMFDRSSTRWAGAVPDATADGQWHHARVELFEPIWNHSPRDLVTHLRAFGFGDFGWPSAREGDTFHIDNVRLITLLSGTSGIVLRASAADALGVAGFAHAWSGEPDAEPPNKITSTDGTISAKDVPEGRQWLHVRAIDRAGNWGPVEHVPFIIDSTPPKIGSISPRNGQPACPYRFQVRVDDPHGPHPTRLTFTVDGKRYSLQSPSAKGSRRPRFVWDLSRTPEQIEPIPNGKTLTYRLEGVEDLAGNRTEPVTGAWKMDYRRDRVPPQRVEFDLASAPVAFVHRYDRNTEMARHGGQARVSHELDRGAASHVLRYSTHSQRPQMAVLHDAKHRGKWHKPFDLAKTGIVKMDVKLGRQSVYADLLLFGDGFKVKLRVGDDPPGQALPAVGKTDQDGYLYLGGMNGRVDASDAVRRTKKGHGWVTVWADVGKRVRDALPRRKEFKVVQLSLGRLRPPFSHRRTVLIDNVMVYGYGKPELRATLRSRDLTELSGFAVLPVAEVDPKAEPKVNLPAAGALARSLKPGTHLLRAVACDGNGNWSTVPGLLPYVVSAKEDKGL